VQLPLVVCYIPFIISFILIDINGCPGGGVAFLCKNFSLTLLYLNSSLNPILYYWKIKEIRLVLKETVKRYQFLFIELTIKFSHIKKEKRKETVTFVGCIECW